MNRIRKSESSSQGSRVAPWIIMILAIMLYIVVAIYKDGVVLYGSVL